MSVPKVNLTDLQPPINGIATPAFATAAEKLAVALSRTRVAVVVLPSKPQAAALRAGLNALLSSSTRSLPGCNVREWRVGGPAGQAAVEEAYGTLETTARLVLAALCRSSLLRLRADAFSGLLDDLPLSRSVQGSSSLAAKAYVDNFSHLSAAEGSAVLPLFADPQEEVSERGLLSLFYAVEASDPLTGVMSAMQVKDSEGRWQDVQLAANEVAVVLGLTMQHATAGLLLPGTHRVVGDPYGSAGAKPTSRRLLQFELRPRPAAVLDLREQLEAAGHTVSTRFSPMSVRSLMEQFESLMSPAAKVATPDQQQGALAHQAWEELQATLKKSKKRLGAMEEQPDLKLPVTRSGNVRRSAEGLVRQRGGSRQRQQGHGAAPAAAAVAVVAVKQENEQGMEWEGGQGGQGGHRRRSVGSCRTSGGSSGSAGGFSLGSSGSERRGQGSGTEPASSALYIVRGRTCTVLDGCLHEEPSECITVCVRSFTGLERWFYVHSSIKCGRIFEMYCARLGISLGAVKFLLHGERVFGAATPESLEMLDGDELMVVPESSDRLQQARELGPLFASVFGPAAAEGLDSLPELL